MNKLLLLVLLTLSSSHLFAQVMSAERWNTGEENTVIETYQKDEMWYGKIISSDNPNAKIGKDILQGFVKSKDQWEGKLYAARKGKLVDAKIVPNDSEMKITVSAGMFKKKLSWQRTEL